jgi:hypothetical protein
MYDIIVHCSWQLLLLCAPTTLQAVAAQLLSPICQLVSCCCCCAVCVQQYLATTGIELGPNGDDAIFTQAAIDGKKIAESVADLD